MARRNLLHKAYLEEFKTYLTQKGVQFREGKGTYQVLQVQVAAWLPGGKTGFVWSPIYEKDSSTEHYTIQEELTSTVHLFVRSRKESGPVRDSIALSQKQTIVLDSVTDGTTFLEEVYNNGELIGDISFPNIRRRNLLVDYKMQHQFFLRRRGKEGGDIQLLACESLPPFFLIDLTDFSSTLSIDEVITAWESCIKDLEDTNKEIILPNFEFKER